MIEPKNNAEPIADKKIIKEFNGIKETESSFKSIGLTKVIIDLAKYKPRILESINAGIKKHHGNNTRFKIPIANLFFVRNSKERDLDLSLTKPLSDQVKKMRIINRISPRIAYPI